MVLLINLFKGTGLVQPSVCSLPAKRWVRALAHKRVDVASAVPVARPGSTKHWPDIPFPHRSGDSCESAAAGLNGPRQEH